MPDKRRFKVIMKGYMTQPCSPLVYINKDGQKSYHIVDGAIYHEILCQPNFELTEGHCAKHDEVPQFNIPVDVFKQKLGSDEIRFPNAMGRIPTDQLIDHFIPKTHEENK